MTPSVSKRKQNVQETMGRRLAAARVLKGMSQQEVATQAGFAQPYLSLLENDKADGPSLNVVVKIADVLGVSLDYLVKGAA